MKSKLPEVRIKFGHFLEPMFEAYYKSQPEQSSWQPPSEEEIKEKVEQFIRRWKPYEEKILRGMTKILGLTFYQNTIDVFIVSGLRGGFSVPMVISSMPEPDRFVDILTHELIHRLISDNSLKFDWRSVTRAQFPDITEELVLNHIFVHAVHKAIYFDVLNEPDRYERDVTRCERFPDYKEAWRIVNEKGYSEIIADFRSRF